MPNTNVRTSFGIDIIPDNDEQRLAALGRYEILDTPPEEIFTNLAHLVAGCFNAPIALISLVDRDKVFFKGNVGMPGVKHVDRGISLCSLAVLSSEPTIIENPLEDPCLLANPLVHGKFGLRFYAGAPIITPDGYNIGTVCVVDKEERIFTQKEQEQLIRFAKLAMHEITVRKAAMENAALAMDVMTREKSFRTLAHNSPDLIVRHGKDYRYLYISPLIEKLTGKKPEEFIGKSYREMGIPEELCRLFDESLATVFRTNAPHRVEYTAHSGRDEVHIYTRLVPEYDENGEVASVMTISTDITERKNAETALRESEKRFQLLANTLPIVVWTASSDGLVTYISDQWEKDYGIPLSESLGTGWAKFVHPNDVEHAARTWAHSIQTGTDYEVEFRVLHKKKDYRWLLVRAVAIRNAAGEIISWYGSDVDIEDKKKAEVILEKKVQERTLELERANGELRLSNQNLEEFAYAASHDMKEPIRKIHFFADRLKERLVGKLENEEQRYFSRLEASTKRMTTLIDDLLVYSHVNRGVRSVETVDLNHVLSYVLDDLELQIEEKRAKLEVDQLPTIVGRPRQLQQLFENLLGNALKYSKENVSPEIHLIAQLAKGSETGAAAAAVGADRMYHLIQIRDNGIGFNQVDAERIFHVFTRLHGNAEGYRGSGIGLSIAQKVVQNHGGYIWAESELGEGSTFKILLPIE